MKAKDVYAYLVPSEDAHQSEYIAEKDARREFISGFTGSAGFALITMEQAALWTDGRYFLQAEKQLDKDWTLMRGGLPETPKKEEWLAKVCPKGSKVGIDPKLISNEEAKKFGDSLKEKKLVITAIEENLIDMIWDDYKPKAKLANIFHLGID